MIEELTITEHAIYEGVPMMDESEAREYVKMMGADIEMSDRYADSFRRRVLDFAEREGWRVLGYSGVVAALQAELGTTYSSSYLSRLLQAAETERVLDLPIGNSVPESVLREVARLDTPDQQRAVYQAAATNGKPTAKDVRQAAAEIARPDLPLEFAVIQRRYASRGYVLSAAWDGAVQRFVVRKDGGTGVVMAWESVLSKLERLDDQAEYDAEHPAQVAAREQVPSPRPASAIVAAYDQQEQADRKLMRAAHDLIETSDYAGARAMLGQVQHSTYERDQVLRTLVRTEAQRFWTEQSERRTRFSPQAMISLTTWDRAMALMGALLEITT